MWLLYKSVRLAKLIFLREADVAVSRDVFVLLGHWLQVYLAFSVEDHLSDLAVQIVNRRPEPLLQLLSHKAASQGPLLERFCNEVVRESLEIIVAEFDLAVVGVEDDAVLNDLDLAVRDLVLPD